MIKVQDSVNSSRREIDIENDPNQILRNGDYHHEFSDFFKSLQQLRSEVPDYDDFDENEDENVNENENSGRKKKIQDSSDRFLHKSKLNDNSLSSIEEEQKNS